MSRVSLSGPSKRRRPAGAQTEGSQTAGTLGAIFAEKFVKTIKKGLTKKSCGASLTHDARKQGKNNRF
jgi:hypothetical protein